MIRVNGEVIENGMFPNKESNAIVNASIISQDINVVTFKFEDNSSLIELLFVKRHIDSIAPATKSVLIISYMPYSRLDRTDVDNHDIVFTLKHVCEFINSLGFSGHVVLEPHSDVTCALLTNASAIPFTQTLFEEAVSTGVLEFDPSVDFLCFPDAGAQKSYGKMGDYNSVVCFKDRDFKTGWINSLDILVKKGQSIEGKNVVILDDLCSKGGTFMLTAKELIKLKPKSISLVVAHCEPTILDGDILKTDLINSVVTSNSSIDQNKLASFDKVFVADFEDYL